MSSTPANRRCKLVAATGALCSLILLAAGTCNACPAGGQAGPPLPGREDCNSNGVEDAQDIAAWGTAFDDASSWAAFDPGEHGVGTDPDGYHGAVFDGRYLYFVPYRAEYPVFTGEVMRYDTTTAFDDTGSWKTFNPKEHGIGYNPVGYAEGVFDGRYVYFVPWARTGNIYHGEVMRYDTAGVFDDVASWSTFDPGMNGIGVDPDGYRGGVFDGEYVYFVPCYNGSQFHCEILRFDCDGGFDDPAAWTVYDPGADGVGTLARGYSFAAFDGRYIYFGPYHNGYWYHGEVLRFDSTGEFTDATSWITFDPGAQGVGNDPDGYPGVIFDGRYVYFAPFNNGTTYSGEVMRYDTSAAFDDISSWATFDAPQHGIGTNPTGYMGGMFDGRFVYFVPIYHDDEDHKEVLRYDTSGDFAAPSSWDTYDLPDAEPGYRGCGYDGHFVYLVPGGIYVNHGQVQRYDPAAIGSPDCNGNGVPDECDLDDQTSADCNDNGVPDECDIASGFSWDVNDNGIPDECEDDCPADINNDLTVNIDDLFAILAAWGPCENCPEDLNDDGTVNIDDLFAVLAQWGPCS